MFFFNVFPEAAVQFDHGLLRLDVIGQGKFQATTGTLVPDTIPFAGASDNEFRSLSGFWLSDSCRPLGRQQHTVDRQVPLCP
ncbi:MAG: hypothetical protein ACRD3T_08580, partial [Terriglobia bacterium]